VFLKSPGVDIFIVYFSGPSTQDGDWVFPHRVINYDDMLVLWSSAMSEAIERHAAGQGAAGEDGPASTTFNLPRLVIVSDSSLSGRWVKRARETCGTMLHVGGGNVAVQASCGDKELAYQHANAGGCFTSMFCSYGLHGNSWRTLPDPKIMQQVSVAGSAVAARHARASVRLLLAMRVPVCRARFAVAGLTCW
jgi:hypothetical protein